MTTKQFTTSAGSHLKNREIFYGTPAPATYTWPVPSGTTEVHVHVWGGGGNGCTNSWEGSGGGGGGYARAPYTVTDSDVLSITVGSNTATSSVTIPTQTPNSPMSALGGCSGNGPPQPWVLRGGAGGTGTVTLHPSFPHYYCMNADGGRGGFPCGPTACGPKTGGGGAAGSPLGTGGEGGWGCQTFGGGIGQAPGTNRFRQCWMTVNGYGWPQPLSPVSTCQAGSYLIGRQNCWAEPATYGNYAPWQLSQGDWGTLALGSVSCTTYMENVNSCYWCPGGGCPGGFTLIYKGPDASTGRDDKWFWVEDMAGAGAFNYTSPIDGKQMSFGGAGAGGGVYGEAGILGGGVDYSTPTGAPPTTAGYAGGAGSSGSPSGGPLVGGHGLVILYW